MHKGLRLFRIHDIDVYLHYSWWFIFTLLAWSLATELFPLYYPGLSTVTHWMMGVIAAILLFVSVLLHELTHSFVAKARNLKVESITLFFFGGVASLPSEDVEPKTEFWMALSGPVFSIAFAVTLFFSTWVVPLGAVHGVLSYLWQINLVLGVFNLVPGYPLDGGRVFRALLMFHYHDIKKATRIASRGGRIVAGVLMFLGFLGIVGGNFSGLWFVFLGGFLWIVAKQSYEHVLVKDVLGKVMVNELVEKRFDSLNPTDNISKLIELYKKSAADGFIILNKKKFVGIIEVRRKKLQKKASVASIMIPAVRVTTLSLNETAYDALRKIDEQQLSMLPVIVNGQVKGVVTRQKLSHYLTLGIKGS